MNREGEWGEIKEKFFYFSIISVVQWFERDILIKNYVRYLFFSLIMKIIKKYGLSNYFYKSN